MNDAKYTIGVDYGTESGRAVLVDVATGEEIASAVHPYGDGVIDVMKRLKALKQRTLGGN